MIARALPSTAPPAPPAPPGSAPPEVTPARHAEVRTVNPGYRRVDAQVLVREIDRPTRANLDFAAYHANFLIAEPPPEGETAAGRPRIDPAELFRGRSTRPPSPG